jgi:antitoxin (DNA-binding transcriptional repressor) of toxin-antitoxin stability system
MKATVVDLRYRMKEVLKALERREKVTLLYHGKVRGTIIPAAPEKAMRVEDHPLFNMAEMDKTSVDQQMETLRGLRFGDI